MASRARGQKAQGQAVSLKSWTPRHRTLSRQGASAIERSLETKVRQAGRFECEDGFEDWLEEEGEL